jgi:phenylalanyl-tRNA synthetase beta chain
VRRGTAGVNGSGRSWSGNVAAVSVHDAKADALAVLEACGAPAGIQIETGAPTHYHPGRSGVIKLGPKMVLATFGEFHPKVLETLDADGPICGFEVYLDALSEPKARAVRTKPRLDLSPFQALKRDFAFIVDKGIAAGAILKAAQGADKKLITSANVFDLFEGASIGEGRKSVAIEVTIQPQDKTLAEDELEALSKRIVENVGKATGAMLRG